MEGDVLMSGRIHTPGKSKVKWLLIAACCAIGLGATVIEQREIRVDQVTVRGGKGVMFPLVGTLKQGEQLSVLEKQNDGWLRVQVQDKEGYVWAKSLEPPPNGGLLAGLNPSKLGAGAGKSDPNASSVTASAAAKGIGEGPRFYASTNNYDMTGLFEMIDARDSVAGNPWFDF